MSALLIAALLAAAASVIATACVAYVVISFRRSGHVIASRVGRRPPALVLVAAGNSRRHRLQRPGAPARIRLQAVQTS